MSVQKKSLISQRAAVTKAIVANAEKENASTPKMSPRVTPKVGHKVAVMVNPKAKLHI
jgi:hypothetical protein